MYEKFYGLREKPFNITPDPRFLYLGPDHREALAHLQYGVQERKGFVVITGEVGTGKTTLVHTLLRGLTFGTKTAFIFSTTLTAKGLLKMMVADFGIETRARTKAELFLELNNFLLRQFSSGANAVLIVDEAQNLSFRLLEEIRMLSNLETDREKLLQIILVGQPELATKLALPQLRQLRQRVSCRYHIHPLTGRETDQYIQHRLKVAGSSAGSIFDGGAMERIYRWSGGIPRLINMICDYAMLLGYSYEKTKIGARIVEEAIGDLQVQGAFSPQFTRARDPRWYVRKELGGPFSWWRRIFRPLAIASGILLGAVLLDTPSFLREYESRPLSSPANYGALVSPWSSLFPDREMGRVDFSEEVADEPTEGLAGKAVRIEGDARFSIHMASFREMSRAKSLEVALRKKGFGPIFLVPVQLPGSGRWWWVMVGIYEDGDAALEVAKDYLASGICGYARPRRLDKESVAELEQLALEDVPTLQIFASQGAQDE